jgi:hypothetical protein
VWCLRQFVFSTTGVRGEPGEQGPQGPAGPSGMTVRDFKELAQLLCTEMNGRYLLTKDAHKRFDELRDKIDSVSMSLANRAERLTEIESKLDALSVLHRRFEDMTRRDWLEGGEHRGIGGEKS